MVKEVLRLKQISHTWREEGGGRNSHFYAHKAVVEQLCPLKSWVLCMGSLVGKNINHRVA